VDVPADSGNASARRDASLFGASAGPLPEGRAADFEAIQAAVAMLKAESDAGRLRKEVERRTAVYAAVDEALMYPGDYRNIAHRTS